MKMDMNQAKEWLDKATGEAQEVIANPSQVDQILIQLEDKLKEVPAIGDTLSGLPTMIAMVKAWVTKEYTEVSPKENRVYCACLRKLLRQHVMKHIVLALRLRLMWKALQE